MTRWRREGSLTKFISWFAPLLLEERDPARVSQIVRRVSGAYGVAAAVWAAVVGLLFDLHFAAMIGALAAAGHFLIALAARRWLYSAAVGFVAWIWVMGLVGQLRTGALTSGGVFLAAIVAAGLVLGARAAIVTAVVTAIATGSIAFAVESGSFVPSGAQPSVLAMWTLAVVTFAAMPVLLGEALGRLRRALSEAQEADRRYSLVADNTRDAIFLIEDGALSYVSPGALALFGLVAR